MLDIIQNNGEKFGEFSANYGGESAGVLQYEWKDDDTFNIVHTEVGDHFEGKGIGKHFHVLYMSLMSNPIRQSN